jgi:hypothetical protein
MRRFRGVLMMTPPPENIVLKLGGRRGLCQVAEMRQRVVSRVRSCGTPTRLVDERHEYQDIGPAYVPGTVWSTASSLTAKFRSAPRLPLDTDKSTPGQLAAVFFGARVATNRYHHAINFRHPSGCIEFREADVTANRQASPVG